MKVLSWLVVCALLILGMYTLGGCSRAPQNGSISVSQAQEDANVVAEYEDGLKLVQTLKDRFASGSYNDEPETSELIGYVIYIRDHAQRASPEKQATYASYAQYLDNAAHYYTDKSYKRPI